MKHTSGPWTAQYHALQDGSGGKKWYEIMGNKGEGPALAKLRGWIDEDSANAQLISLAPELLEVCKYALSKLANLTTHEFAMGSDFLVREALEQIIAKAEGSE